jgi:hypothetical protein
MGIKLVCACAALVLASTASAATVRVSLDANGNEAPGIGDFAAMTPDAHYVGFISTSPLVATDTNARSDVYVRDRVAGTLDLVSISTLGAQPSRGVYGPVAMSSNGRFVLFSSTSHELAPGIPPDTNGRVFVRDRLLGITREVDVSDLGAPSNAGGRGLDISADGRYATFESIGSNLDPPDTNFWLDVFVHDLLTGDTEMVSTDSADNRSSVGGSPFFPRPGAWESSISDDGRYVSFTSDGADLVPGDTNATYDVFVKDRLTGQTTMASVDSDESIAQTGSPFSGSGGARISGDGRYVFFVSAASNLVADGVGAGAFARDRVAGTTARFGGASTHVLGVSTDGRFVVVSSESSSLVPGDTNGVRDAFLLDRQLGTTTRVSVAGDGSEANGATHSEWGPVADDGQTVAFSSVASNLVPGDTNGRSDVFLWTPNRAPVCNTLTAAPASLWPANHKFVAVAITGASDPDGDQLAYTYAVTQDEPVDGTGDGDTAPDAQVVNGALELRTERSGNGDGRVYSITVTVGDGQASCTGTLTVSVPNSPKKPAVAGPDTFDSFGT